MEDSDTPKQSFADDIFLSWMFPVARYYRKNKPTPLNLLKLTHQEESNAIFRRFLIHWSHEIKKQNPSFFKALVKTFLKQYS